MLNDLPPYGTPRKEYDDEGYYIPDPDAPINHKLNPCHCDHYDFLTPLQRFFAWWGSDCRCCSGARIFLLMMAICLSYLDNDMCDIISCVLAVLVSIAVAYDHISMSVDLFVRTHNADSDDR